MASSERCSESPRTGNAEYQVDGEVAESGSAGSFHRIDGLCGGVAAVHRAQAGVVERLDADREPVDACAAQCVEIRTVEVVGIGFEGGFLHGRAVEKVGRPGEQASYLLRRAERWSASAEVTRADGFAAQVAALMFELVVHGFQHVVHAAQVGALEEVAVSAHALAERDMEIESGHGEFEDTKSRRKVKGLRRFFVLVRKNTFSCRFCCSVGRPAAERGLRRVFGNRRMPLRKQLRRRCPARLNKHVLHALRTTAAGKPPAEMERLLDP